MSSVPKPTETSVPLTVEPDSDEIKDIKTVLMAVEHAVSHWLFNYFNGLSKKVDPRPSYDLHMCRLNCALAVVTNDALRARGDKLFIAAEKYLLQEWSVDDDINSLGDL